MVKPILFNSEMVRAILDGRKTCTRRVIKAPGLYADPNDPPTHIREWEGGAFSFQWNNRGNNSGHIVLHPPYKKGDILYVRETWFEYAGQYVYKATAAQPELWDGMWHPSIHMPREAARIFLRVTDVRAERLQSITEVDAQQEGAGMIQIAREVWSYRRGFRKIWDNTVKPADLPRYGWDANPWVWVIEFERCEKPEEKP